MKLDSIHQPLVKWSTSEYGWLSSAITLERSSIRAAKALSLIEINDTRRGLVDDSGTFFLRPDRWLRRWELKVIVYSTLIKYTRCLRSSLPIINIDLVLDYGDYGERVTVETTKDDSCSDLKQCLSFTSWFNWLTIRQMPSDISKRRAS